MSTGLVSQNTDLQTKAAANAGIDRTEQGI